MKFMLDTNVLIGCLRRKKSLIESVEKNGFGHELYISTITYGEIMTGIHSNDTPRRRGALHKVLAPMTILDFDQDAAAYFGLLKHHIKSSLIGPYDLQIAAHAISKGLTLVTHNTKEFGRIKELKIIDWEVQ
jgi:tRNA(fMet)-specific endonuclease VapC